LAQWSILARLLLNQWLKCAAAASWMLMVPPLWIAATEIFRDVVFEHHVLSKQAR